MNNIIAVAIMLYYVPTSSCAQYRRYCSIAQKPKYDTRGRLRISLPYIYVGTCVVLCGSCHTRYYDLYIILLYSYICILYFELAQGQIVRSAYKICSALAGLCAPKARVYRIFVFIFFFKENNMRDCDFYSGTIIRMYTF